MKNILHVMFSTNRLNYLARTFEGQKLLDFSGYKVHRLFIDDYPQDRDDLALSRWVEAQGFNEVILHCRNQGITNTWQELFDIVRTRNYDYIFHQEDDVAPTQPIRVSDMIAALESDPTLSQIQLKRNNWYTWETEPYAVKDSDKPWGPYWLEQGTPYFWMLMSVYPAWIADLDWHAQNFRPSEWVIAQHLLEKKGLSAGILKAADGTPLVNHFGESARGKRVNPGEPGWEKFQGYDPSKTYCSRTGRLLE
jgi:hypothetical protein